MMGKQYKLFLETWPKSSVTAVSLLLSRVIKHIPAVRWSHLLGTYFCSTTWPTKAPTQIVCWGEIWGAEVRSLVTVKPDKVPAYLRWIISCNCVMLFFSQTPPQQARGAYIHSDNSNLLISDCSVFVHTTICGCTLTCQLPSIYKHRC